MDEAQPRRDPESPKNPDAYIEWVPGVAKFVAQMVGSREFRGFPYTHRAIQWLQDQGAKRIEWK